MHQCAALKLFSKMLFPVLLRNDFDILDWLCKMHSINPYHFENWKKIRVVGLWITSDYTVFLPLYLIVCMSCRSLLLHWSIIIFNSVWCLIHKFFKCFSVKWSLLKSLHWITAQIATLNWDIWSESSTYKFLLYCIIQLGYKPGNVIIYNSNASTY